MIQNPILVGDLDCCELCCCPCSDMPDAMTVTMLYDDPPQPPNPELPSNGVYWNGPATFRIRRSLRYPNVWTLYNTTVLIDPDPEPPFYDEVYHTVDPDCTGGVLLGTQNELNGQPVYLDSFWLACHDATTRPVPSPFAIYGCGTGTCYWEVNYTGYRCNEFGVPPAPIDYSMWSFAGERNPPYNITLVCQCPVPHRGIPFRWKVDPAPGSLTAFIDFVGDV